MTCTRKVVHDRTGIRDVGGNTTDDQTRTRRLVQDAGPDFEKKPQFEIDLDEEKTKEINEKLNKFKLGSSTKSIRNDFSKGKMIFSEESNRAIHEMGNMELVELRQTSATIQCPSCLKHVPEGLNMCQCGVWLRPNQSTMDGIRTAFAALKTLFYRTKDVISRGMKSGHNLWQKDHMVGRTHAHFFTLRTSHVTAPTWWSSSSWDRQWQDWHSQGWQDKELWARRLVQRRHKQNLSLCHDSLNLHL